MPNTMTLISTVTVGAGGAANIEFTSIAGTATDLYLVVSGRSDTSSGSNGAVLLIRPNGSSANGTARNLYGTGSAAGSDTDSYIWARLNPSDYTSNTFASTSVYIPNYAGSTNKSVSVDSVNENNATAHRALLSAQLWSDTSAITSITLLPLGGNFVQYTTASLYTITKGSGGATVS